MDSIVPYPHPERQSQLDVLTKWEIDLRFKHGFDQPGMRYQYDFSVMIYNLCRLGLLEKTTDAQGKTDIRMTMLGEKLVSMCADRSTFKPKSFETK